MATSTPWKPVAALGLAESGGLIRLGMAPYCTESDIDRVLNTVAELAATAELEIQQSYHSK